MKGNTLKCIKSFFIFEEGESYYCFAEKEGYVFLWHNKGCCGVNEIKLPKEVLGKNFTY